MRAILIDSEKSTIVEIILDISKDITEQINTILNAKLTAIVHYIDAENIIVINAEGNHINSAHYFYYIGAQKAHDGKALIIGINKDGERTSCLIPVNEVTKRVKFFNITDLN